MLFSLEGNDLWEAKLEKLRSIQPKEILEKLRISFDSLEYEQKQIYLDIACFFSGKDVTEPSYMWDDCGFHPRVEISALVSKSLITIGLDNRVIMHDQLIDLGLQIVREERELGKQSRFRKEEGQNALLTNQGTKFVTALDIYCNFRDLEPILASHFSNVPNIRFLISGNQHLYGDFKRLLLNLRWLRWNILEKLMPTNMHMENLVILDLSGSNVTDDGEIWCQIKVGKKLKVLDLSFSYNLNVPPYFSSFATLEILKIEHCKSMCRLDGLEQLKLLKHIDASGCVNLESLPNLSSLQKLVYLKLEGCSKLVEIQGLENLGVLRILNAEKCTNLNKIEGLHNLNSLENLVLEGCSSLEGNLDVTGLKKLRKIDVGGCFMLSEIKGLHTVISLEDLDMLYCIVLEGDLDFSELKRLKRIIAQGCRKLTGVNGLHMLTFLEHVNLLECSFKGVLDLSNLKNIQELHAANFEVTNLRSSIKLKKLSLVYNDNVLNNLQCLDELEELRIDRFNVCVGSMDFSHIKKLKSLVFCNFFYIEKLPCLANLRNLVTLYLWNWEKLVQVEGLERLDLPTFAVLKHIDVHGCNNLYEVEIVGDIGSLEYLRIANCPKLKEIGDLQSLRSLKSLSLWDNKELTGIRGLDNLKSLEWLNISGCDSIETLPDFSRLEKLTNFDASCCIKLSKMSGLEELQSLKEVDVRGCERLGVLPDLPNTTILRGPYNSL